MKPQRTRLKPTNSQIDRKIYLFLLYMLVMMSTDTKYVFTIGRSSISSLHLTYSHKVHSMAIYSESDLDLILSTIKGDSNSCLLKSTTLALSALTNINFHLITILNLKIERVDASLLLDCAL
jgi:hypothetical protein